VKGVPTNVFPNRQRVVDPLSRQLPGSRSSGGGKTREDDDDDDDDDDDNDEEEEQSWGIHRWQMSRRGAHFGLRQHRQRQKKQITFLASRWTPTPADVIDLPDPAADAGTLERILRVLDEACEPTDREELELAQDMPGGSVSTRM